MGCFNAVKATKTIVQMRCESKGRNPGGFWSSPVSYDAWGAPYAKSHDGSLIRLDADGRTGDSFLYGTQWKHVEGDPVSFAPTEQSMGEGV